MHFVKTTLAIGLLVAATATPAFAQEITDPSGTFVDEYGTSFDFSLCGDGTELCGVLTNLEGNSATEENLAYVGHQVMQAQQSAPKSMEGLADGRRDQCRGDHHPDRAAYR